MNERWKRVVILIIIFLIGVLVGLWFCRCCSRFRWSTNGTCCYQDSDEDGIFDIMEDSNRDKNLGNDDMDQDGIPDYLDSDNDNDGIANIYEDLNQNGNLFDDDSDHDGVANAFDNDDNNDNIPNIHQFGLSDLQKKLLTSSLHKKLTIKEEEQYISILMDIYASDALLEQFPKRFDSLLLNQTDKSSIKKIQEQLQKKLDDLKKQNESTNGITTGGIGGSFEVQSITTSSNGGASSASQTTNSSSEGSSSAGSTAQGSTDTNTSNATSNASQGGTTVGTNNNTTTAGNTSQTSSSSSQHGGTTQDGGNSALGGNASVSSSVGGSTTNLGTTKNGPSASNGSNSISSNGGTSTGSLSTATTSSNNGSSNGGGGNTQGTSGGGGSSSSIQGSTSNGGTSKSSSTQGGSSASSNTTAGTSTNHPSTAGGTSSSIPTGKNCSSEQFGTLNHTQTAIGYSKEFVEYGDFCSDFDGSVTCNDGVIQGNITYPYASCNQRGPKSCQGPDGTYYSHNDIGTYYKYQFVQGVKATGEDVCPRQARVCKNGVWIDPVTSTKSNFFYNYALCKAEIYN